MRPIGENGKYINKQPICNRCKHHIEGLRCKAFNEIPDIILSGVNDHTKPLPEQDNNIVFEEID